MNNEMPPAFGTPPQPVPSTLVSRLTNIFVTPGEVFAEVKTRPVCHQNWVVPALIFLLASWCAVGLMFSQPAIKQQMADLQEQSLQKQFHKQVDAGKMTQAQVDQIKASAGKFAGIGQVVGFVVSPVLLAGITPFWGGFVIWAGAAWFFRRPMGYLKAVEIAGLAMMIEALGALVKGLLCAGLGSMLAAPGPILLVKHYDPASFFHAALLMLDVFLLWALAVRAIGLAKLSEGSRVKALVWIMGVWFVITGGTVTLSWSVQKAAVAMTGQ